MADCEALKNTGLELSRCARLVGALTRNIRAETKKIATWKIGPGMAVELRRLEELTTSLHEAENRLHVLGDQIQTLVRDALTTIGHASPTFVLPPGSALSKSVAPTPQTFQLPRPLR